MFEMALEVKKLDAEYRNLSIATAAARSEIEKNRDIANDETKSFRERQAAIKAAAADQETLDQKRLELAGRNLALAEKEKLIRGETPEILDKIAEASVNLLEIEADISARRRQDAQAQRAILNEQREKINQLREAYARFLDELQGRSQDARLSLLGDVDRIIEEREIALNELQKFKDEIIKAATAAGQELPVNFEEQFKTMTAAIEKELEDSINQIRTKDPESRLVEKIESLGERAARQAKEGLLKGLKVPLPVEPELSGLEAFKQQILDALKITEEEAGLIFSALGDLAGSVVKGFDDIAEAQLEKTKAVTDAIEEQIKTVEGFLQDEQKLREQGYANDAKKYEEQLATLNELKDKSEQEAAERERKLARQRLAVNAAEQVSEYALASIRLIASQAKGGLVGLVLGIGGLALIARLVTQARAAAIRSAEVPKFREGTPFVHGPGSGKSDSIPAMLSRGERVIDSDSNSELGGAGVSNYEIVRIFKIGKMVDGVAPTNVLSLAPILKAMNKDQGKIIQLKDSVNIEAMREAYQTAADKAAGKIIDYMKTRPINKKGPNGEKVTEWYEGNILNRQITKQ